MTIQNKVAKYVADNGIKQTFISDKTGLDKNVVSGILTSKRKMSVDEFELFCRALKVLPGDFINMEE